MTDSFLKLNNIQIDYQGKIAALVAAMTQNEQEQAFKMIEILALKLD